MKKLSKFIGVIGLMEPNNAPDAKWSREIYA
jgi:hypothetical protein